MGAPSLLLAVIVTAFVLPAGLTGQQDRIPARGAPQPAEVQAAQRRPQLVASLDIGWIDAVAYSPDGRFVLTGSQEARLWEVDTGRELRRFEGHLYGVRSVAFSPDGRQVLTGGDSTARIWDTATGLELRRFEGHTSDVRAAAFSPNGRYVVTASVDGTARLWDTATGNELRRFQARDEVTYPAAVAFSPDGRFIVTGSGSLVYARGDRTPRLWEVETGREVRSFAGHAGDVTAVAFSPDGRQVLSGSTDRTIRIWEAATGTEIRRLGNDSLLLRANFSPDGTRILTGGRDGSLILWDVASGRELRRLEGHPRAITSLVYSRQGNYALTGGEDGSARLWDVETGREIRRLEGLAPEVEAAEFSDDLNYILTGGRDSTAKLWDATTGREIRRFAGHLGDVTAVAFLPGGRFVVTASRDQSARLWELLSGREVRRFEGHSSSVNSVAVSPDGRRVLTGSGDHTGAGDHTARLWDVTTGNEVQRFVGHGATLTSVAFSPDGRHVVTGASGDFTSRIWDAETGSEIRRFTLADNSLLAATFSPDGRFVLTGSGDDAAQLWDLQTGREMQRFVGHTWHVGSLAFSSDGLHVLTGSWDATVRLWEVATGREVRRFVGHSDIVTSASFSPDGRYVLTSSNDGTTRMWDAASGEELARLVSFRGDSWAVVDRQGRFDASAGGDVQGLHWVVETPRGPESIALQQLKNRYYDPGLLAKLMGHRAEPLRGVETFNRGGLDLHPEIRVAPSEGGRFAVQLTDRGGGIGRVVVSINGKEVASDARAPGSDSRAESMSVQLDLRNHPYLLPGQPNEVEVRAYNSEGYLVSRGIKVPYLTPDAEQSPPSLWAIVVGVSDYAGDALDLRFAAKDATDFAAALELAAHRLFGEERTNLTLLSSGGDRPPTRKNLVDALETVASRARSTDVLVVYLAGHGTTLSGQDGDFQFLTQEALSGNLSDDALRQSVAVSSEELTALVLSVPALKQVLILDTCHSGRVVERLTTQRDVPSSQIRALERMKDRAGLWVLAGSAADAVSYEATRYGQGLLTYSLLMGMRGAALREEEEVDVSRLFNFATDQVPILAAGIGGIQRPALAVGGASFAIGLLDAEAKAQIPIAAERPLVLRSNFQETLRPRDLLGVTRHVNEALRTRSYPRGGDPPPLVYLDADEFPDAYLIGGRYRAEGDSLVVAVEVYRGEGVADSFEIAGSPDDLELLADAIVKRTEQVLAER